MKCLFSLYYNFIFGTLFTSLQDKLVLSLTWSVLAFKPAHPCDDTPFSFQGLDSNLPMDQRRYINPGDYLDLMELLQTFTTEVNRSKTKLKGLIGQGTVLYHCLAVPIFRERLINKTSIEESHLVGAWSTQNEYS